MNLFSTTAQQTGDWRQNEDDVLQQLQRLGAVCHEIPRDCTVQTATREHTELVLDALRCIEPVELRVYQQL